MKKIEQFYRRIEYPAKNYPKDKLPIILICIIGTFAFISIPLLIASQNPNNPSKTCEIIGIIMGIVGWGSYFSLIIMNMIFPSKE